MKKTILSLIFLMTMLFVVNAQIPPNPHPRTAVPVTTGCPTVAYQSIYGEDGVNLERNSGQEDL